jgi:cephalosporin hydroxylase
VHFNGLGRHKHIDFRRSFRLIDGPLLKRGSSDLYANFLDIVHRWIARVGQSAMSWTFYGTGDARTAFIPDPDVMSKLAWLHHLVRSNGYSRILESGTGLGVSTACIASAVADRSQAKVVTIDLMARPQREVLWQLCSPELRACIDARTGDALEGLQQACANGEQYDLALLDSSHEGQHVWKEFQLATRLVKPNGLILIHDVTNIWESAGEAVPRIEAAGYGVVRLWTERQAGNCEAGLGLAMIENRRGV